MQIKPTDSLFFGSGKPFNAGADSWTDSSFLPNPSVIWGALFTLLHKEEISKKGAKFRTTQEEREKLKIKNIYLYNEEQTTILTPAPLDIFVDSDGKRYAPTYKDVDFISNYSLKIINIVEDKEVKPIENSFIEINSLYEEYCEKNFEDLVLFNFDEVFVADYKIGIKIDKKTKTAKENHLYRVDLTQFKKEWSFLVEYESDIEFEDSGVLKLGGEGKTAIYKKIDKPIGIVDYEDYRDEMIEELKDENEFRVLFKTPVYFENGWQPQQKGLVCANVGKPISIGGFDMETKSIKEMKKYIPAGSIYLFSKEIEEISFVDEDSESYKGFGSYELLKKD
jgi:CRISPR-associated protein Cmr3